MLYAVAFSFMQIVLGIRSKLANVTNGAVLNAYNAAYSSSRAGTLSTEQRNVRGGSAAACDRSTNPSLWSAIVWALPTSFWTERLSCRVAISELPDPECLVLQGLIDMTVTKARHNVFDMK